MAIQRFKDLDLNCPIYIATDSEWSLGVLGKDWVPKTNTTAISKLRAIIKGLTVPIKLIWVRAHSGLERNDFADAGAKRGAKESRRKDTPTLNPSLGFTYRHWGGDMQPD